MNLGDLMPLAQWEGIERDINQKYGLDANFFNIDGIRITSFRKWANRLCPTIKATDKGQSFICAVAHMSLAAEAKNDRAPMIEECDGGLLKIVVPIFVGDEFVGAFGACGFVLDDGEVDTFLINKVTEISEDELEALSEGIRSISREDAASLVSEVQEKIRAIVRDYQRNSAAT